MALEGILGGFNEQRGADVNYLAQLEAMRRSRVSTDLDQQRLQAQQDQYLQDLALRQKAQEMQGSQNAFANSLDTQRLAAQQSQFGQNLGLQRDEFADKRYGNSLAHAYDQQKFGAQRTDSDRDYALREAEQKLKIAGTGGTGIQPPQGYRFGPGGALQSIPGGPSDPNILFDKKNDPATMQKRSEARDVLNLTEMAAPYIGSATHSYLGQGVDAVAGAFGISTQGAQDAARLKALEGMLISKMPKMSGPQSDKDVLLYKQMAGQIGDASVPADQKKAALDTIRQINSNYAGTAYQPLSYDKTGQQPASAAPATNGQQFNSLPDPRQFAGKTATDTTSGTRWRSTGNDWVRVE